MSRFGFSKMVLALSALTVLYGCGGESTAPQQAEKSPAAAAPLATAADVIVFDGPRNQYVISKINQGYLVTDLSAPTKSSKVGGVSKLQFTDLRVNLEVADLANSLEVTDLRALIELYIAFFNRMPDSDGLAYWIKEFKGGMKLENIAESFYIAALSYPAQVGYSANMSNEDFIRIVYKNVLGRSGANAPNQIEVDYWAKQLNQGQMTKGKVVQVMLKAAYEYANDATWSWVSQLLYNKIEVGHFFAVKQGISYNTNQDTITKTSAIAAAITDKSTAAALALIDIKDSKLNLASIGSPDSLAGICNVDVEKSWARAHLDDAYLWYKEIIEVNPARYATSREYFKDLLVRSKDRFSFTDDQGGIDDYFQSGTDVSYGASFVNQSGSLRIRYVQPGSPAEMARLSRGATIVSIDGSSTANGITQAHIDALYPNDDKLHRFEIRDQGSSTTRTVSMNASKVTISPVQNEQILNVDGRKYGYLLFTDHIRTAESPLYDAMTRFKAAKIDDLILDLRYNGGGYLYIANELAAMIGGKVTYNQVFEQLQFNDKYPEKTAQNIDYFYDTDSTYRSLPYLNLPRVFVLVGSGTCSASESIINGLSPFVQVVLIGQDTCGKPYGFIQKNNCKTAYFAIQFAGVNAKGQGDYANGFKPQCYTNDDLEHALGTTSETRLAAALSYARTGKCPATAFSPAPGQSSEVSEKELRSPVWRQIKLHNR